MQPKIQLRYSPDKTGFVSALFYIELGVDVYGWYAESLGRRFSSAFFMLENFYANRPAVLYQSMEDDVYGMWISDSPMTDHEIRCPLPEPVPHELERIQSQFVQEWLFFENDPAAATELAVYRNRDLPLQAVNIKPRKLQRLGKTGGNWEHNTSGSNADIFELMHKRWNVNQRIAIR
jgi:hypothetical protein